MERIQIQCSRTIRKSSVLTLANLHFLLLLYIYFFVCLHGMISQIFQLSFFFTFNPELQFLNQKFLYISNSIGAIFAVK